LSHVTKVAHSVSWNIFTGLGSRAIGLVGTLLLTRFIAPDEYGLVSAALITVMTAAYLTNLQFGQYIIMKGYRSGVSRSMPPSRTWPGVDGDRDRVPGARHPRAVAPCAWHGALHGWFRAGRGDGLGLGRAREDLARDLRFRIIALTKGMGEVLYTAVSLSLVMMLGGMALVVGPSCGRCWY